MSPLVRRVAKTLLRSSTVSRAVRALARVRGHRLVLVYHRLGPSAPPRCGVVPAVPVDVFRAQLQALCEVVDLVTIDQLLASDQPPAGDQKRPAVALTFDDDLPSHAEYALPVLREVGVPAAFFLSGRVLHGLGSYWFQQLEALLIAYGERRTAALLRVPEAHAGNLAQTCEGNGDLRHRVSELAAGMSAPAILDRDAIAAFVAAGMTVGFHTVEHDVLPDLDDPALENAVSLGREDLAAAAGAAVRYFAYPHGKADTRSAVAVRRAGFSAAFTGRPQPVREGDDLHCLGRWEPGPLGVDDLLVTMAMRLHRAGLPSPLRSS
jgi:peptidoglycan/xylan/chitin deacetylase (PgdA/CDA1 family)